MKPTIIKDKNVRFNWFLIFSLVINLGYAIYNLFLGIGNQSAWFIVTGVYYLMLGGMKLYCLVKKKKFLTEKRKQYQTMRLVGFVFFLLALVLTFLLFFTLKYGFYKGHSTIIMISIATYTFYKIIISIINFIKAKKGEDVTLYTIRNINIAEALVSMLTLQMSMYQSFGTTDTSYAMNIFTGATVCLVITILGILMIVISYKSLKKENQPLIK